jgi:hypothetical protein
MQERVKQAAIAQLERVLSLYEDLQIQADHQDLSGDGLLESEHHKVIAHARAAIERISGPGSSYLRQAESILENLNRGWIGHKVIAIMGVVESLLADTQAGYLDTLAELLHAEVFGDLIEMAQHLLDEGYKDPAAVIVGGALEAHLRRLCERNSVEIESASDRGVRPKKADQINSELAAASVYSKLDQKNVTAWLDLRNRAAHGRFDEYSREQVLLFLSGVRDFITRHPA